tara:strand:+ start:364 stop:795 length:432 start_codon:yes stop_codon:yes gene_type:complete
MTAAVVSIADAIVTKLNADTFDLSFTAVRKYAPLYRLRDMDTLHVTVVPSSETITQLHRTKQVHEYTIDVGVQQRFSSDANTTIDPLADLVQDIADAFAGASLSGFTSAAWVSSEIEPIFAPDHFTQFRQFTSVIRLMYRVHR